VHLFVVPLEVLAVWRTPASLTITSEPAGAEARLDGSPIEGLTPTRATIKRDRFNHVLQLSAPGYRPTRQTVRFDGSVKLAVGVRMDKETGPTFEALPPPAGTTPARKASAATATSTGASAKAASRRSARIVKATAKATKGARGKGIKAGAHSHIASKHH
jgi:hypothetical protein